VQESSSEGHHDECSVEGSSISLITFEVKGADGVPRNVTVDYGDPAIDFEVAAKLMGLNFAPEQNPQGRKINAAAGETVKLAGMVRDYLREIKPAGSWTDKTYGENESIFMLLKEVLKNPTVSTINHKQASDFKNTLLQLPSNRTKGQFQGKSIKELLAMRSSKTMAVSTVNKYIRRVASLFDWGVRHR
jgi:hypothetical protein